MLVIGIGNAYRSDDGVGPAVARALQTKNLPGVQCKEDPGDTLSLIEQWDTAYTVMLIDAVSSGAEPGMIYRFEDFTACGLDQALDYVEGYDRAMAACRGLIPHFP